jgi:CyaY protein
MDDKRYRTLAADTLRQVIDLFDDFDVDLADVESAGDVVTITLRGGGKVVVNTQGAVQQIWLAGGGRGWHFTWDDASTRWVHDKGSGDHLFGVLDRLVRDATGRDVGGA